MQSVLAQVAVQLADMAGATRRRSDLVHIVEDWEMIRQCHSPPLISLCSLLQTYLSCVESKVGSIMYLLYKQGRKAYKKHQAKRELDAAQPPQPDGKTQHHSGDATHKPIAPLNPNSILEKPVASNANTVTTSHQTSRDPSPPQSTQPTESDADNAARHRHRYKLVLGLLVPYFISSTDVTIVAPALPYIASHFHQLGQLNWIVTAFTIPSCAFIPVWGGLADSFGRYPVLLAVMVIMMIG